MENDTLKLELIEWLTKLDDNDTIEYLKIIKDSSSANNDWWDDLSESQKAGIERGINDIKTGKTISHDEVKAKYGL